MSAEQFSNTILWTFNVPCAVPADVMRTFVPGEQAVCAYKTIRDVAVFTNKRIIVRDAQGLTGQKVETYSLPYKSIVMYSTENAGKVFDINTEVEMWTLIGRIKIRLSKHIDIREIDRIIANAIL